MTIEDITNNGIVGAGGAGFPTHIKLEAKPEFLILNAAECEPLIHKDAELLLNYSDEIIKGFQIAMAITNASQGIIGIKAKHKKIINLLKKKLANNIRIELIGDFYPAGDEVLLVYLTTARIIQPGALPISVGCIVQNVETIYNIAINKPVVEKFITVAGAVDKPLTIKVPIGTTFAEIISKFNITSPNYVVRSDGLLMGTLEQNLDQVVTKTNSGLIILPADHHCVSMYERYLDINNTIRIAKASCDQCTFCTELCPRYLLGHPVRPEIAMRNRMFSQKDEKYVHNGNAFCCECNLCTLYSCPESLDPRGATVLEKRVLTAQNYKWEGLPVSAHPMNEYRKVPTKKLMQRLDVLKYIDKGPLSDLEITPSQVRIPLAQHIGTQAKPVVDKGQKVKKYDLIAKANGKISANIHSSIDGKVAEINSKDIIIKR